MTGDLLAIGVSHKTAPLALREKLALPEGRAVSTLRELTAHDSVREAVAISTCNRTELYLVAADAVEAENATLAILSRQAEIRPTELLGSIYSLHGAEAVRHLFSVAAGLDSMIVGEAEVQGQVKRAYELALVEGATGPISNRLFRDALAAGKRVRTETEIGRSRVSISSVAVELAAGMLGDLSSRRVLVIGAGENGELTAQALRERGVHTVFVANRRYDRAIGLAQRFGGTAVRFDDLPTELGRADIVVSCTASPHQIFGREELEVVVEQRGRRPLVLIDIAVPRDIEPSVRDLCSGITLFDMDDLQQRGGAQPVGARGGGGQGPHDRGRGGRALRPLARDARRGAHDLRPARACRADRRAGAERERVALGDPVRRRPGAGRRDGAGDREPPAARADAAAEGRRGRLRAPARAARAVRPRAGAARAAGRRGHRPRVPPPPARVSLPDSAPRAAGRAGCLRLGTRGSALALAQAELVAGLLDDEVELVPIRTSGDRGRGGDKARFVKEIEEALLDGAIDLAVHSAKDVPSELPEGLSIVGVPERADPRDALCGAASLEALEPGAVVGTGSLRRRSQLLALRPDLEVRPLRGNVDTRLRKLGEGEFDALVACSCRARAAGARLGGRAARRRWCRRRVRAAWRWRRGLATPPSRTERRPR